jgi:hypothetical protein
VSRLNTSRREQASVLCVLAANCWAPRAWRLSHNTLRLLCAFLPYRPPCPVAVVSCCPCVLLLAAAACLLQVPVRNPSNTKPSNLSNPGCTNRRLCKCNLSTQNPSLSQMHIQDCPNKAVCWGLSFAFALCPYTHLA